MKKAALLALAALLAGAFPAAAQSFDGGSLTGAPTGGVKLGTAAGTARDAGAAITAEQQALATAVAARAKVVPVCNRATLVGDAGVTSGSFPQMNSRLVALCPRGAKSIQLMFPGIYAAPAETDLTAQIPVTAGIEVISNGCTPNSNCPVTPVTFGGALQGMVPVVNGAAVDQAFIQSDLTAVNVPAAASIAVRTYVNQAAGGVIAYGRPAVLSLTEGGQSSASGLPDRSLSGSGSLGSGGWYGPAAILGIPQTTGPSGVIVGDSISAGYSGPTLTKCVLASGGSGYVAGDVGRVVPVLGGTFATQGSCTITAVASGAVTAVAPAAAGAYTAGPANPAATGTGVTTGTGLTVTATVTNTIEAGDAVGNQGYLERALAGAGNIAWSRLSRSGDRGSFWATRSYGRMAMLAQINPTFLIDELDVNDTTSGLSAATIEANDITRWSRFAQYVPKVIATTTTPGGVTSTDVFATTGGQTISSTNAVRIARNAWLRAGAPVASASNLTPVAVGTSGALVAGQPGHPLTGFFDVSSQVETSIDTGIFVSNGTAGYCTYDGTHLASPCITLAQAGVNTAALQ